jgi:hypothetical protein
MKAFRTEAKVRRALSAVRPLSAALPGRDFTFLINGAAVVTSPAEAAALSPEIAAQLSVDACARTFSVCDPRIGVSPFDRLLSQSTAAILGDDRGSLGLLFGELWNNSVEAAFLVAPSLGSLSLLSLDALDSLLSEAVLGVGNEDSLFCDLLKLGRDYFVLLRHVRWSLLRVDSLSMFDPDPDFTPPESVWHCIADSLPRLLAPLLLSPAGFDSAIVQQFPDLFAPFRPNQFNRLWRGSRDGFGAMDFHGRCDGHANTLTLIEDTGGNIFGGFTPAEWDSNGKSKADPSLTSFLFTLKNPHNFPARKFALTNAIHCNASCSPYFGDIAVCDNCKANTNWADLGRSYANDTGLDEKTFFTGSRYFQVKEIEVFEITD